MDKEYISSQQCMLLMAGFGVGTSLLLLPTILVQYAKQGANISTALALIPGILIAIMLSSLNKWYPGQSLVQYSVSILGIPGKTIGLLYIWFAFHLSTLVLRNIGDFVGLIMLPQSPTQIVYCVVVAISALALLYGIETTSKAMSLLITLAVFFSIMLIFFTLPHGDFKNMLPFLGNGWGSIIKATIYMSSFPVGEFVVFGMIIFHIRDSKKTALSLIKGQFIGLIVSTTVFIEIITLIGVERAERAVIPIVSALNSIPGSNLLLIPFAMTWFIFAIVKFMICYYAFVLGFSHLIGMSDYKPLVLPGGALIICIAIVLFEGVGQHEKFNIVYWPAYALSIEYGILILLWLTAGARMLLNKQAGDN